MRAIPGLTVIRPADANETAEAWAFAVQHDGPDALRAHAPERSRISTAANAKEPGVAKGAYILSEAEGGAPDVILIGTGSEVALCVKAQEKLKAYGVKARVVSMPSMNLFEAQDDAYRESVLPKASQEARHGGSRSTFGWHRWAGDEGTIIGIDRYGASAPGDEIMKHFGFTVGNVTAQALGLLGKDEEANKEAQSEETAFTGPTLAHA